MNELATFSLSLYASLSSLSLFLFLSLSLSLFLFLSFSLSLFLSLSVMMLWHRFLIFLSPFFNPSHSCYWHTSLSLSILFFYAWMQWRDWWLWRQRKISVMHENNLAYDGGLFCAVHRECEEEPRRWVDDQQTTWHWNLVLVGVSLKCKLLGSGNLNWTEVHNTMCL